jgi:aryl-alcohol dehydrogenase-like predicted oxidoreductase
MGGLNWVNGHANGWANVDEAEISRAIQKGLDAGVNHFDNADVYGNGKAERMLARILGAKSKDLIISSKCGHFPGTAEHAYEPQQIRHQCEQSLINLKRDHIDIYYFHHGDFGANDRYLDGALEMMSKLKQEGKIRVLGLSAYSIGDFVRLIPKIKPALLQSWASALDIQFIAPDSPVSKLMKEHKLSFVAFSPLQQGLLLDKYSSAQPPSFDEGDHRKENGQFKADSIAKVSAKMQQIKGRFGSSPEILARVALQYLMSFEVVACCIPGFRNEAQVSMNLAGADQPLSPDDITFVHKVFAA